LNRYFEILVLFGVLASILIPLKYTYGICIGGHILPNGKCSSGVEKTYERHIDNETGLMVNEKGFYENQTAAYEVTLKLLINKSGIVIPNYLHPTIHQLEQIVDEINSGGYPYKILNDMRNELIAKQELAEPLP
jgi:hypothetical protein